MESDGIFIYKGHRGLLQNSIAIARGVHLFFKTRITCVCKLQHTLINLNTKKLCKISKVLAFIKIFIKDFLIPMLTLITI